jgi:aryl-alcohol dehydrogenase-like predicted oxidoreductase
MRNITIPHTGLNPSVISLGCADFGGAIDRRDAFALLDAYAAQGGNFIDTASVYNDWIPGERSRSEKLIGEWLKQRSNREQMILATKGAHPDLASMHIPRLSPREIQQDVEASLRHLGVERIDLFYLHRDDPSHPVEEILTTLHGLVQAGKLGAYACSNWSLARLRAAQESAAHLRMPGFAAVQNLWSLAHVETRALTDPTLVVMNEALWDYHRQTNLAAVPFSSQANGLFHKLAAGQEERIRPNQAAQMLNPTTRRRFERLQALQAATGWSVTQIVLGYLMGQPFPTIPVIGPHSLAQLADSLTAAEIQLTPDQARGLVEE